VAYSVNLFGYTRSRCRELSREVQTPCRNTPNLPPLKVPQDLTQGDRHQVSNKHWSRKDRGASLTNRMVAEITIVFQGTSAQEFSHDF
jgi:hypothetical protein